MFEYLKKLPPDPILGLIAAYDSDRRDDKIDLGVGVYRDEAGDTPILRAVKAAEARILEQQVTKTYTSSRGDERFNSAIGAAVFGSDHPAIAENRMWTIQTPGGSGALRVAAWLVRRSRPDATVWTSDPTWANHVPLLGGAGLNLDAYPYYHRDQHRIRIEAMLKTLDEAAAGDLVLLHGCCHNPCGLDLSAEWWQAVAEVMERRGLVPFIDMAYQGLADGWEEDAMAVRDYAARFPEAIIATSYSKNFALYRDRVGALSVVARDGLQAEASLSQAVNIVRTMYSVPPDHGAAVVTEILNDADLNQDWRSELESMRVRLGENRRRLAESLAAHDTGMDFSHIARAKGMFSFLGLKPAQVDTLQQDHGVYMTRTSRINIAGINPGNIDRLCAAVAAVTRRS